MKNSLFFILLLLTAISVFVPFSPGMPWEGLDPSFVYGMNEALAQGMVFGKDIIFTYGPYASILTKSYHPAIDKLMIFGSIYFAIFFSLVAYLNFRRVHWMLHVALLITLSVVMYSRDSLFFFYPLLLGVQVYQWTNSFDAKKSAGIASTVLLVSLFAPLGLLPLVKGSALIACVAITLLSMLLLIKRGLWSLCLIVSVIPVISMLFFWALSNHPLTALYDYLIWLLPLISGFTDAMSINGSSIEIILYIIVVFMLVGFLLRDMQGTSYDKLIVILMFLCILFLAFKAGFVRHDCHAVISGSMILMAAILVGTLITNKSAFIVFLISLIVWIYIDAIYFKTSFYSYFENWTTTYSNAWNGIKQRTLDPDKLEKDFDAHVTELMKRGAIPKLNGTVDIYSYDLSYLIASGNKWNPRPIVQSYSVFTSKLAEINKEHLLGENRPDNIIFKVQPIDGRFPSLEDGASWPVLLTNYEPTDVANEYLYLTLRTTGKNSIQFEKSFKRSRIFGEQIELPDLNGLIFIKLHFKKSTIGTIISSIFKPSELQIKLVMENGTDRSYRMIAGMAESGFIVSPLVENTHEFGLLFAGANYIADKNVKTIEINANNSSFIWKNSFEIEIYSFNYKSTPSFIDKLGLSPPNAETFTLLTNAQQCYGSIDYINGHPPTSEPVMASSLLYIQGWLAASIENEFTNDSTHLVLTNSKGEHLFIDTKRTNRPDVGLHFNKPSLSSSGFTSAANVSDLKGDYVLGLAYSTNNKLFLCPHFKVSIEIFQK